jgi:hypothetical protein
MNNKAANWSAALPQISCSQTPYTPFGTACRAPGGPLIATGLCSRCGHGWGAAIEGSSR